MIEQLRQKRAKAIADARSIMNNATNRDLTEDEARSLDGSTTEAENLGAQIARMERLTTMETEQEASRGRLVRDTATRGNNEFNEQIRSFLLGEGLHKFNFNLAETAIRSADESLSEWQSRAQSVGTASAGGYT